MTRLYMRKRMARCVWFLFSDFTKWQTVSRSASSYYPFKQSCSIVIGQCYLEAQGFGLNGIEVHGAGRSLVGGIAVGTLYGQPLAMCVLIEDAP